MIKVGVIGCGHIGQEIYIPGLVQIGEPRVQVVALFDTVQQRVDEALALAPGASGYTTYDDFLAHPGGIDLVFNLTPAPLHRDITARALEADCHVYSEKPIAATVQEAEELVEIANAHGKQLLCAPSTMVTARMQFIKQMIESGELGEAWFAKASIGGMGPAAWSTYMGDPRVFYRKGVGPLIDLGVYMLHTITGLLGPVKRVSAVGGIVFPERPLLIERFKGETVKVETPDILSVNLEIGENRYANLLASYATPATKSPLFEVYARKGSISIAGSQWYNGNGGVDIFRLTETETSQHGEWENDVLPPTQNVLGDILGAGIMHVVDVVENGVQPVTSAEHATHVLEIMNAVLESGQSGKFVDVQSTF